MARPLKIKVGDICRISKTWDAFGRQRVPAGDVLILENLGIKKIGIMTELCFKAWHIKDQFVFIMPASEAWEVIPGDPDGQ